MQESTTNNCSSLIDGYKTRELICFRKEIDFYTDKKKSIKDVIQCAAQGFNYDGKRHPHQRRIKKASLSEFSKRLLTRITDIECADSFETLIRIGEESRVNGVGDLVIYDTALRIGAKIDKLPDKIYLHCGTREGVEKLLGEKNKNKYISITDLPEPFSGSDLNASELENFFCVMKGYL